ncbi:cation transport regulator ChaB [Patescibacteria group bacterium]|nr:cation transport regulator ChaB [Patescibacteria group bacterium]
MPYKNIKDLPERIKDNLPKHAQEIYRKSFNNAWKQYKDPKERKGNASREEVSHKVAWAAVKQKYKKIKNDWKEKNY